MENNTSDTQFPKPHKMALNFLAALGKEALERMYGTEALDPEQINQRFSICTNCEFFHSSSKRCIKCGCNLLLKTAWKSQSCPIGKW
jgi:hypothetical protein